MRKDNLTWAIILFAALLPYFINLGANSIWDSNEAFYAETPRVMLETGDFISPSFNDQPRFNKPPLSYWVVAGFYKLFGVSEAVERIPIALGALTMIATAFLLGRLASSTRAGLLAALALALAPRFLMFSRRIIIDVHLAMYMGLMLLFFALAATCDRRRRQFLLLMYVSAGLGVLTKGPVAIVLPALVFLIYLAATRRLSRIRELMLPLGAVIVTAIVLPWHALIYQQHGWSYISEFLLRDNLSRFAARGWSPPRGLTYYLTVVLGDLFPWSLFLAAALLIFAIAMIAKRRRADVGAGPVQAPVDVDTQKRRMRLLLALWVVAIVGFYSLSRNKIDLYVLPAYTAAAAIIGVLLDRFISGNASAREVSILRWAAVVLGLSISLAGTAALIAFDGDSSISPAGATLIGAVAAAGGLLCAVMAGLKRRTQAIMASALTVVVINWVFVLRTLPDFERYKPARTFSRIIDQQAGPDALIGYYGLASPSMVFYLRRPIFEHFKPEELEAALVSGRTVYCLIREEDYESLKDRLPPTRILARNPVFQVKFSVLFGQPELPQAVLITNRVEAGGAQ